MKRILVTGAGGYIGSVLVGELLAHDYEVVACDRFFFGTDILEPYAADARLRLVKKDVRDIEESDLKGVWAVCDLASLSNDPSGDIDPQLTYAINHEGRVRVATCARKAGVERYVLSSSCSVYGHGQTKELTEDSQPNPLTTYAKAAAKAEDDVLKVGSNGDLTCTVLRNATVFGLSRRMRFDLVVNLMTLHAVQRGRIIVMGGGRQWRPLVHVRDVAHAFRTILEADRGTIASEIFNLGLTNVSILSLAYLVRETLPFPVELEIAPDDPDKRNYSVSFRKLQERLGISPKVTIPEGVTEVYNALKLGQLEPGPKTSTVNWYRYLIEAKQVLDSVLMNGRLL